MTHAIQFLTTVLKDVPTSFCDSQLAAIEAVQEIFTNGQTKKSTPYKASKAPLIPRQADLALYRTPTSKGGQENQLAITSKGAIQKTVHTITKKKNITINSADDQEPIARRNRSSRNTSKLQPTQTIQNTSEPIANITRSRTFTQKYMTPSHSRALATQLLTHVANSVSEQETGKQLKYGQLRKHPIFQETWNRSFSNEMGRLCQGVGTGTIGIEKRVEVKIPSL